MMIPCTEAPRDERSPGALLFGETKGLITIGKEKKRIDWNAIRAEYIGGGISQRRLAEKHGLTYPTLRKHADAEGWVKERDKVTRETVAKVAQKTADAAADNATIAARIKRKLLLKIETEIEAIQDGQGTEWRETVFDAPKKGDEDDVPRNPRTVTTVRRLRDLASMYKDLTADMQTAENAGSELLQSLMALEREVRHD